MAVRTLVFVELRFLQSRSAFLLVGSLGSATSVKTAVKVVTLGAVVSVQYPGCEGVQQIGLLNLILRITHKKE